MRQQQVNNDGKMNAIRILCSFLNIIVIFILKHTDSQCLFWFLHMLFSYSKQLQTLNLTSFVKYCQSAYISHNYEYYYWILYWAPHEHTVIMTGWNNKPWPASQATLPHLSLFPYKILSYISAIFKLSVRV